MGKAKPPARKGRPKRKRDEDPGGRFHVRPCLVWIWENRNGPAPDRMEGYAPGECAPQRHTGEISLTKPEFMAFWHISRSYFYRLIDKGLPVRSDGRINFYEGGEWYTSNVGPIVRREDLGPAQTIEEIDNHDPFVIDLAPVLDTYAEFAKRLNTT
ncbi:MAG: hypothetical protein Q8R92_20240 [Deltaproteobacteria bacterium]|nr:hypothetical protein [Deltaproteobacteria bacterium]